MTKSKVNLLGSLFVAGALAAAGCGGGSSGGSGGSSGTGGKGGSGGAGTGIGGAGGTGAGGSGTGGSGAGGKIDGGAGGATDGGQDSGAGGAVSDAATDTDAADASAETGPASHLIPIGTFDTDLSGFSLLFVTPTLQPEGGAQPTAEFDSTTGKPDPGSAQLTIPFTPMTPSMDEHVEFGKNFTPTDMTGRILTARVMLDAIDGSASPGVQAFFVIKSATATNANAFIYANGAFTNLSAGNWVTVVMLADSPGFAATGFDPTRIEQVAVGIQGDASNAGLTTASVHIDSIGYQ